MIESVYCASGIDLLIEIDPKDTREKRQHGGEGQEQQDRPDCNLVQTPLCQGPKGGAKNKDEGKAQAVTDVHGSEKISRLPIEVETAGGTAIVHFREAPINGRTKNFRGPASRTQLVEDAAQDGRVRREQEHMIVDRYGLGPRSGDNPLGMKPCVCWKRRRGGRAMCPPQARKSDNFGWPIQTTARS